MTATIRVHRDDLLLEWTAFWQVNDRCGAKPGFATEAAAHEWAEEIVFGTDEECADWLPEAMADDGEFEPIAKGKK